MPLKSFKLTDKDIEKLAFLREYYDTTSDVETIRRIINDSYEIAHKLKLGERLLKENFEKDPAEVFEDMSPELTPDEKARRHELKQRAKLNMEKSVEMVDTPFGPMTKRMVEISRLTNTELTAGLNGQVADSDKVKDDRRAAFRKQYPEATEAQIEEAVNREYDSDGNPIYES